MLDELLQMFSRGKEIEVYGDKFVVVHSLGNHLYFAVRVDAAMPAQIFLIEDKPAQEKIELERLAKLPQPQSQPSAVSS